MVSGEMYNELLSVRSIPGILSPRLLICSIRLPRTTSPQQLHPLHWPLASCTSPQHLSMVNRGSTLCTFLLYITCGIFSWIVNLSDLSWHQSLHKLVLVLSPATYHPTSNFLVSCSLCFVAAAPCTLGHTTLPRAHFTHPAHSSLSLSPSFRKSSLTYQVEFISPFCVSTESWTHTSYSTQYKHVYLSVYVMIH